MMLSHKSFTFALVEGKSNSWLLWKSEKFRKIQRIASLAELFAERLLITDMLIASAHDWWWWSIIMYCFRGKAGTIVEGSRHCESRTRHEHDITCAQPELRLLNEVVQYWENIKTLSIDEGELCLRNGWQMKVRQVFFSTGTIFTGCYHKMPPTRQQ